MKKILVVEDDHKLRKVIVRKLENDGFMVYAASNGRQAFEMLQNNDGMALIITDIMMPEMDGRQFISVVRGNSEYDHTPIIAMSAVIGPKEISNLLEHGATRFVGKPIKYDRLKAEIDSSFDAI